MEEIPIWRDRQRLLHSHDKKTSPETLRSIGELCFKEGRFQEALDYFSGAKDTESLRKLASLAIQEGDSFLLQGLEKALGTASDSEEWNRCGAAALDSGKLRFARVAFEKAQNEPMLSKVTAILEPAPQPVPAANDSD